MKLWTVQPKEVRPFLETGNIYHCDPALSEYLTDDDMADMFIPAYDYMREMLLHHYPTSPKDAETGLGFPIWAWYKWDDKHKKPDLRQNVYVDSRSVVIELEVPDHKVLLSDSIRWNNVIMNCAVDNPDVDDFDWDRDYSQEEIVDSWKHIFTVDNAPYIQGCFWSIEPEYVVKYHTVNRKPKDKR